MEVRKGFKQTEIGVIPEDWEVISIQELMDSNTITGHLDGNHGALYPRSHEFVDYGVPYITANELTGYKVSFSTCKYLTEERAKLFRKGVAKDGDVLFAHNATVGPTALLSTELDYVILSTTATYFRCNPEKLINAFLLYSLQSEPFVRQYRAIMAQSTRNQVPITAQRKLSLVLPPTLAEQEAIAEALSDADALIESLETLLAKKRQVKQGAMSELLSGKRRLPGFSGEWKRKNIKSIVQTPVTDGPHLTPVFLDTGIPFLSVNNIVDNVIDWSDLRYISLEDHQIFSKKCKPQKNDILLGKAASVGKVAIVETDREFNIWSPIAMIRVSKEYSPKYVYYSLQTRDISRQIEVLTNSSSQGNIGMGEIEKIEVPLPEKDEQTAIAEILSDMDAEIRAVEEKLSKARAVKAGMMSALLGGRIRLNRDLKD